MYDKLAYCLLDELIFEYAFNAGRLICSLIIASTIAIDIYFILPFETVTTGKLFQCRSRLQFRDPFARPPFFYFFISMSFLNALSR